MMPKISLAWAPAGLALTLSLTLSSCAPVMHGSSSPVVGVEFTDTPVAKTTEEYLSTYSRSVARVKYADGTVKDFPLAYNTLFQNTDQIASVGQSKYAAAQLYDVNMAPLKDPNGDPVVAETADANSLLRVGNELYLVNHWEYDWLLADGREAYRAENWYTRMPMSMSLSRVSQSLGGKLSVKSQRPVDFSSVNGGWIFCFGSQTPWNTHIGGEEDYDLYFVPGEKAYSTTQAGLKAMTELYFGGKKQANPYHYGFITEVAVRSGGGYDVSKLYNMGRGTWEAAIFAKDGRTAFYGDDGAYSGLFMFVGEKQNDPRAGGSLYAAKWTQTSDQGGGAANLTWVKLGRGTYAEVKAIIDRGTTIADIFEFSLEAKEGFRPTRAGSAQTIWLKLKPGMEQAAAFLETRRYAAYLGATTEFTKNEGAAINHADKKLYATMSRIETSMKADDGGPQDDIRIPENKAGATYTLDMKGGQTDTAGAAIASEYVPVNMYVESELLGRPIAADADGNTADVNSIANTDNVYFSERLRTLFVGEDSGMHVNNYVWAYNVDTKKKARILNVAAGAESTGLQVVEDLSGHAYIMSNNQHQGDWISSQNKDLTAKLTEAAKAKWGVNRHGTLNYRLSASVGYIGGLPGIK